MQKEQLRICHISIFIHESNQPLSTVSHKNKKLKNAYRYVCIFKILQFDINSSLVIKKLNCTKFMNEKKRRERIIEFSTPYTMAPNALCIGLAKT